MLDVQQRQSSGVSKLTLALTGSCQCSEPVAWPPCCADGWPREGTLPARGSNDLPRNEARAREYGSGP